jgi:CRISPR/Cas system-associated endonuclease Cas3-HD
MQPDHILLIVIILIGAVILINSFVSVAASLMAMVASMTLLQYARKSDLLLDRIVLLVEQVGREVEHARKMRGAP